MKRRIKIRRHGFVGNPTDNNLAKFQPNWFRGCRLGVQNACTIRPNYNKKRISTAIRLAAPIKESNNSSLTGNKKPTYFRGFGKLSCLELVIVITKSAPAFFYFC